MATKQIRKKTIRASPPRPGKIAGKELFILGAIILLGLLLRLYTLDQESLWLDEGYVIRFSETPLTDILTAKQYATGHPPFFFILLKIWLFVLGTTPISARLLSVLAGVAALPAIFLLGKKLFDNNTALVATALLAVSSMHQYYSQEVHSYTLLALEVTLSMLLLAQLLESPRKIYVLLFTLINALGLYTHLYYAYIMGTHFLVAVLFLRRKNNLFKMMASLIASCILFIPWAASTHLHDWQTRPLSEMVTMTGQNIQIIFMDFLGLPPPSYVELSQSTFAVPPPILAIGLMAVLVFIGVTSIRHFRKKNIQISFLYCLFPLVMYKMVELIIGPLARWHIPSRYFIIILPAFLLLLARGISAVPKPLSFLFILLLLVPQYYSLRGTYLSITKEDWRGAAEYIRQNFSSEIPVLVLPHWTYHPLQVYLRNDPEIPGGEGSQFMFYLIYEPQTFQPEDLPQKIIVVTSNRHLEFETAYNRETEDNRVLHYLNQEYASSARKGFFGSIDVGLYMKNQLPGE